MIKLYAPGFAMSLFLVLLGGCLPAVQNEPSKFYLLRAVSGVRSEFNGRKVSVGIGPIGLPQYLDRPQIVTHTAGNELNINEFNRWAEPLQHNFARVLASDIGEFLNTDEVFVFPWGGSVSVEYQVKMEVSNFIGQLGGESFLVARWSIVGDNGTKVLMTRRSRVEAKSSNASYEALITAMNQTVTDLSHEIAAAIRSLTK